MAEVPLNKEDAELVEELRQKYSHQGLVSAGVTSYQTAGKCFASQFAVPEQLPADRIEPKPRCDLQMKSVSLRWGQSATSARARAYS